MAVRRAIAALPNDSRNRARVVSIAARARSTRVAPRQCPE